MERVYLISAQNLKDYTPINDNVDDSLLHNAIIEAQEISIQELLGTKLYKKILSLVKTDDINLPANAKYKELLDEHITKVVLYDALLRAIPYIHYKVVNKGITTQFSTESSTTTVAEMEFLMDQVKNNKEFFATRLSRHLLANIQLYPEYMSASKIDEMIPNVEPYHTSMVLDEPVNPCVRIMGYNWRTVNVPW